MTREVARCALVLLALLGATSAAWQLLRVAELLRATPLTTVLLDMTPVRARIDAAIATVVGGDVDALIRGALAGDDPGRARALAEAAERHGRSLDPATLDALAASGTLAGRTLHQVRDLGRALSGGPIRTTAGLATALAFELSPAADVRDLAREGTRAVAGQAPDRLLLGLSAAGLAATAASLAQPVAGGTALAGKAALKALLRGGRMAPELARDVRRALGSVGPGELTRLGRERAGAGGLAGTAEAARLTRAADALGAIAVARGPRTALLAAGAARSLDDLPALERIARELGGRADDAFRVLGQSAAPALRLGRAAVQLAGEIAALALALLGSLAGLAAALPRRWLVRRLRRAARAQRPLAAADRHRPSALATAPVAPHVALMQPASLLALGIALLSLPAAAETVGRAAYTVHWGGFEVASVDTALVLDAARYRLSWSGATTGFLGRLFPLESEGVSEGARAGDALLPERFAGESRRPEESRPWSVAYAPDGRAVRIDLPDDERDEREPVPAALQRGPDPLTLALETVLAAAPGLSAAATSFDGRRAMRLSASCGAAPIPVAGGDDRPRPALLCIVQGEVTAGRHRRWHDRDQARREPVRVRLERGVVGDLWWPVRIEAPTRWGLVVAHLDRDAG